MTHSVVRSHSTQSRSRLRFVAALAALTLMFTGVGAFAAQASPESSGVTSARSGKHPPRPTTPLTNLSHLNFLLDTVPLNAVEGHTTFNLDEEPTALAPWTYADKNDDGSFTRIGGGDLDPASGHWGQGAYNADDIARTAVVYLRHWQQTGDEASREKAFQTLRSLTYLQTTEGPNAGNVVLWQQADGTLTPSATPIELPDPSDSAESYWVARTVWALGEGYAAFTKSDPQFAAFLKDRLHLSLNALNAQSLGDYGQFDIADGVEVPSWLIAGGADASAEAVLGLAAYTSAAPDDSLATTALTRLSEGVAGMSSGSMRQWPFGAIMPWNKSQTLWHAWGGLAPAAVATASTALDRPDLLPSAVADAVGFTPQLLAAGGPDNAWSPTPGEAQIAYGVDSRLQSLVSTAAAAKAPGLLDVAAVTAAWYFGANRSNEPAYHPADGTAVDGIERDGRVNANSGAESTIHALLSMLTLDANPGLKAQALGINRTVATDGLGVVEAETGTISGVGSVVTPDSAWTGEANISGGAFVALDAGAGLRIPVTPSDQPRHVYPIINQTAEESGTSTWASGPDSLGTTQNGGVGDQGITDAPGKLSPLTLEGVLPAGASAVDVSTDAAASVDALLLQPLVSTVSFTGPSGDGALYVSAATTVSQRDVTVPRGFVLTQKGYDAGGKRVKLAKPGRAKTTVVIAPGGFTMVSLTRR